MEDTAKLQSPSLLQGWLTPVRQLIFGRQNERIEYVMDSYFKLPPEGRTATLVGLGIFGILAFVSLIMVYIFSLSALQTRLDNSFLASNKLREARSSYSSTKQKFTDLEAKIDAANQGLVMISVLESKAKEFGLATSGFPPQLPTTELPTNNPLSAKYQNAKVEYRIANVSLKKLIDYVVAVESMPHMLKVSSLKIKGLYQNKLFFDATLEVDAVVLKK